jgi:cell division protein FtsB
VATASSTTLRRAPSGSGSARRGSSSSTRPTSRRAWGRRAAKKPPKKSNAGDRKTPSRTESRRAARTRRSRLYLLGSVALSLLILGAWFPTSSLYHQHQQLASTSSEVKTLRAEDRALGVERSRLSASSEIERLARQQYQLVAPGQRAYQVLPFNGSGSSTAPFPGDPGLAGPVSPTGQAELPAGSTAGSGTKSASATSGAHQGVINRILQTLEFWR